MKRTISGMDAYSKMIGAKLPEKTSSYTPISHSSVISRVRSEIVSAGYIITGEDYRATNDGQIAVGTFRMNYKSDPHIDLCANFINSYNKQYAFRFSLGGVEKESGNALLLSNTKFGSYKRVHKGSADILAAGKIKEFIKDSDDYWKKLIERKEALMSIELLPSDAYTVVGDLFFDQKILNTMQMNTIRSEMEKPSFDYRVDENSAWALYNHIAVSLKDSHPADWMNHLQKVDEVFCSRLLPCIEEEAGEVEFSSEDEVPASLPF